MKFRISLGVALAGLLAFSCGNEETSNEDSAGSKKTTKPDSNFSNTANASEFKTQGKDAQGIFTGVGSKLGKVKGSNLTFLQDDHYDKTKCDAALNTEGTSCEFQDDDGNTVVCTIIQATSSTICNITVPAGTPDGSAAEGLGNFSASPDFSMVELFSNGFSDCKAAFAGIETLYEESETKLNEMLEQIENADKNQNGMSLEKIKDADAAISYKFSPTTGAGKVEGIEVSGTLKGSADDDSMRVARDWSVKIDMSKIGGDIPDTGAAASLKIETIAKEEIVANLKDKVIDYITKGSAKINDMEVSFESSTRVKGGDLPIVETTLNASTKGAQDGGTAADTEYKANMTMEMKDANTIEITGTVSNKAGEELLKVDYKATLTNSNGTCTISEEKS